MPVWKFDKSLGLIRNYERGRNWDMEPLPTLKGMGAHIFRQKVMR